MVHLYLCSARTLSNLTASTKTNRIMGLCAPEVSSMRKDMDDNIEFATDMEEPVCEVSEDNHQQ